jgi:hypothetical protein
VAPVEEHVVSPNMQGPWEQTLPDRQEINQ